MTRLLLALRYSSKRVRWALVPCIGGSWGAPPNSHVFSACPRQLRVPADAVGPLRGHRFGCDSCGAQMRVGEPADLYAVRFGATFDAAAELEGRGAVVCRAEVSAGNMPAAARVRWEPAP